MNIPKLLLLIVSFLLVAGSAAAASRGKGETFVEAPFRCTVLKEKRSFKKRFRDIRTEGRFVMYRVELTNGDSVSHRVDFSCFCVMDDRGTEYEVHPYASMIKQTELEDISLIRDTDDNGFSNRMLKPGFRTTGWLIFEVPGPKEYRMKFRGYLQ